MIASNLFDTKAMLNEANAYLQTHYGKNLVEDYIEILANPESFNAYVAHLSEGLDPQMQKSFAKMAANVKNYMLAEAQLTTSWSPYQQLALPLLRVVFPRLAAKEAVTVSPIDAPEVVKYFLVPVAITASGSEVQLPTSTETVSQASNTPIAVDVTLSSGSGSANAITAAGYAASDNMVLSRNAVLVKAEGTDGTNTETVDINQDIDPITGQITYTVNYSFGSDTLHVSVDWESGNITVSSIGGHTTKVTVLANISLETNVKLPKVRLERIKIPLSVIERALNVEYSVELMQDMKALLDIDYQAELVSILGKQIANDIDIEIIQDIITQVNTSASPITDTFNTTPPTTFAHGQLKAA